ncbi:MAG: EI24 domain-containing protein [Myxococcota bacterium]
MTVDGSLRAGSPLRPSSPPSRPVGRFRQFREGVFLFAEGLSFLRGRPGLWPLAVVPVLLALIFVGIAVSVFWAHLDAVRTTWAELLPVLEATDWWTWIWVGPGRALFWFLGWLAVVISFAVALVGALFTANLLSAPFLDRLSERVEILAAGGVHAPREDAGLIRETLRSFAAELGRLGFLAGLWISLTLAGFVLPGAHLITGPLLVLATVLFLPLDYAGFALDRRGLRFSDRRRWLRANLSTMGGFGGVAFLASLVPGLNLLIAPILVTAGTLLVTRMMPDAPDARQGVGGAAAESV